MASPLYQHLAEQVLLGYHRKNETNKVTAKGGILMRLILLRHGKAEEVREGISDKKRALTSEGRLALNENFPSLARYLMGTDHCEIWTSPLRRAKETGEVLVRYMPGQKLVEKNYLEDGDLAPFLKDLTTLKKNTTVVVVGHEPYLSEWVESLSHRRTRLKRQLGFFGTAGKKSVPRHSHGSFRIDGSGCLRTFGYASGCRHEGAALERPSPHPGSERPSSR